MHRHRYVVALVAMLGMLLGLVGPASATAAFATNTCTTRSLAANNMSPQDARRIPIGATKRIAVAPGTNVAWTFAPGQTIWGVCQDAQNLADMTTALKTALQSARDTAQALGNRVASLENTVASQHKQIAALQTTVTRQQAQILSLETWRTTAGGLGFLLLLTVIALVALIFRLRSQRASVVATPVVAPAVPTAQPVAAPGEVAGPAIRAINDPENGFDVRTEHISGRLRTGDTIVFSTNPERQSAGNKTEIPITIHEAREQTGDNGERQVVYSGRGPWTEGSNFAVAMFGQNRGTTKVYMSGVAGKVTGNKPGFADQAGTSAPQWLEERGVRFTPEAEGPTKQPHVLSHRARLERARQQTAMAA